MYKISSFDHKPTVVFSVTMLNSTSSAKHRRMELSEKGFNTFENVKVLLLKKNHTKPFQKRGSAP
jgi:hypothetical protein